MVVPSQLLIVLLGTGASLVALWRSKAAALRLSFSLITWVGVLTLGAQPEVWRLSDNPLSPEFWQSHYWAGVAVTGLMLFSLAARPEIRAGPSPAPTACHGVGVGGVAFCDAGHHRTRDLLEIPLSWQKPAVYACDFDLQRCP